MSHRRASATPDAHSATAIEIVDALLALKDKSGRDICELFMQLPDKSDYPDYYEIIKHPIAFETIKDRAAQGDYETMDAFRQDIELLVSNAKTYNRKGSMVFKDATVILAKFNDLYQRVATDTLAKDSGSALDMKQIYSKVLGLKVGGRRIAEIFKELPDKKDYPEYYEIIKQPIALDIIKRRIDQGQYKTIDDFERDIVLMVDNAKTFNDPSSQVHADASEIMRQFLLLAGKDPAKTDLHEQLAHFSNHRTNFAVGDFAYVGESGPSQVIGLITKIWKSASQQIFFKSQLFLRAEQTIHPVTRKFYQKEVFKSDRFVDYLASEVTGKCAVLFIKDYLRGFPAGFAEEDIWCCESRFIDSGKRMEKIKNWKQSLPDGVRDIINVELVPHSKPLALSKVDSPFYEDKAESGDERDSFGSDDLEESEDGSFVDPKELKRRKPQRDSGQFKRPVLTAEQTPRGISGTPRTTGAYPTAMRLPASGTGLQYQVSSATPLAAVQKIEFEPFPVALVKQFHAKDGNVVWRSGPPLVIARRQRAVHSSAYQELRSQRRNEMSVEIARQHPKTACRPSRPSLAEGRNNCEQILRDYAAALLRQSQVLREGVRSE